MAMMNNYVISFRRQFRKYVNDMDCDRVHIRATTEASALEKFKTLCGELRIRVNQDKATKEPVCEVSLFNPHHYKY